MGEDKTNELKALRWRDNKERALSHKWYAIGRMDLLIIAISGAGLYVVFELIKYFRDNHYTNDLTWLKWSAIFFTFAIITNFVSQFFGFYANQKDAIYNNNKFLNAIGEQGKSEQELIEIDCYRKIYDRWVNVTNWLSVSWMGIGIVILTIYNYIYL